MGKRLVNILRGMSSVLEIAPIPDRETIQPLYTRRGESPEYALYRTWRRVGNYLITASGAQLIGETKSEEGSRAHQAG